MDWKGALRARLIAAAPVNTPVAGRVYWVDRPQAASLPAITLQTVSQDRKQHMKGFDGLSASIVQVDIWGRSSQEVSDIAEAVIAALAPENTSNGIRFSRAFVDGIRDLGERTETAFIHRTSLDFTIHHTAA